MKSPYLSILIAVAAWFFASPSEAKTLWSNYSLTFLKGADYEVGDPDREVITFEYANGSTWGDSFMFFDRLMSDDGSVETYGEFTSRYKVKTFDGFVKNIYAAGSVEMGPGNNYLFGIGTDLNVPHFKFLQLNLFHRSNAFGGDNMQATLAWSVPIGPLSYSGFMDYTNAVDDRSASMNLTSQLGYDLGPLLALDNTLLVGIEYVYWNNKFGIDAIDERNANLLLKYHF